MSGLVEQFRSLWQVRQSRCSGGKAPSGGSTTGEIEVGSPISSGDPLLSITDISSLSLRAEVDETDVLASREKGQG